MEWLLGGLAIAWLLSLKQGGGSTEPTEPATEMNTSVQDQFDLQALKLAFEADLKAIGGDLENAKKYWPPMNLLRLKEIRPHLAAAVDQVIAQLSKIRDEKLKLLASRLPTTKILSQDTLLTAAQLKQQEFVRRQEELVRNSPVLNAYRRR